jgi:hypothetical protein
MSAKWETLAALLATLASVSVQVNMGCVGDERVEPLCTTIPGVCSSVQSLDVAKNMRTRMGCDEKCGQNQDCKW